MKLIKWLVLLLLAGALAFAFVIFFSNYRDEALRPEVAAIFTETPQISETQTKAYFYALGIHSGAESDFEKRGRELYAEFTRRMPSERRQFWDSKIALHEPWDETFIGCVPSYRVCTPDFVNKAKEIRKALDDQPTALARYIGLMNFGAVSDVFRGDAEQPFTNVWLISQKQNRKMLLQLSIWIVDGKAELAYKTLRNTNLYAASLLKDGTYFEVANAAQVIGDNAEFVKAEMDRVGFKPSRELLESFLVPENRAVFDGALKRELLMVKNITDNFLTQKEGPILNEYCRMLPLRYLIQPARTYNDYWSLNHDGKTDVLSGSMLENPLGQKLLKMSYLRLDNRKSRIEALLQRARDLTANLAKN